MTNGLQVLFEKVPIKFYFYVNDPNRVDTSELLISKHYEEKGFSKNFIHPQKGGRIRVYKGPLSPFC